MVKKFHLGIVLFAVLAVSLGCGLLTGVEQTLEPASEGQEPAAATSGPAEEGQPQGLGPVTFAAYVTDDGEIDGAGTIFPEDTRTVYAYFEFWGMEDGGTWGYALTWDGYEYIDATGEAWEDGNEGWVAYYFEDLEPGEYELTLFLSDRVVQIDSFSIGEEQGAVDRPDIPDSEATFGAIEFATGVTDDLVPIRPSLEFEYGIVDVYAVFPYFNLSDGTAWQREWLFNGEADVVRDLVWEEGVNGMTYAYYGYEDDATPLDPGNYTLNLYIDGQLVRSADFAITGGDEVLAEVSQGPAAPEEIIDPNLIPAWELLAYAHPEILRDVAQFALDHHIEMVLSDEVTVKGTYRCSIESREPGKLFVGQEFWEGASWEEVAGTMAHELTHAVQHIEGGRCGCTIENEYYAYITEFYVLQETGRMDLLETKWRGAYDENGKFDPVKLWNAVKEAYPECPDY